MATKTIYVKDEALWDRARDLAGDGQLSGVIQDLLAKWVVNHQPHGVEKFKEIIRQYDEGAVLYNEMLYALVNRAMDEIRVIETDEERVAETDGQREVEDMLFAHQDTGEFDSSQQHDTHEERRGKR